MFDVWHLLMGRPLKADEANQEQIGTTGGLAALSLDALSSVAYGPEAIAAVLVTAGASGLRWLMPITWAIVALLAILVLSYSQVIVAYPAGGGSYAVSKDNFGDRVSLLAAASLIVDYVLTVAVSIAAGVAALTSAFPVLLPHTVLINLLELGLILFLNLRGVGESARAFLLPTFVFIVGILTVTAIGLLRGHPAVTPIHTALVKQAGALGVLLVLKAFAAGCSALTGVEAIANGVPLFREPRVVRARRTEWLLGGLLGAMLLGVSLVTVRFHLHPVANQTLLSQVIAVSVGHNWAYYVVSLATTVVLGLAANTSFGGLPLLLSLLARDHYAPHIFAIRGDRLVFNYGIGFLAILSGLLLVAVKGNTNALIPMFAIGVFIGFTLSQAGLVKRWIRTKISGWPMRATINGVGALATGTAALVFVVSKFVEGAWVVVVVVPLLIVVFGMVHRYYVGLAEALQIGKIPAAVTPSRPHLVIVPFSGLSQLTARALSEATALGHDVLAVTVLLEPRADEQERELQKVWEQWNPPARLVALRTRYRSVVRPITRFINTIERSAGERIIVLIPEVVPHSLWERLLHNHLGTILASHLRSRTDVVVSILPLHINRPDSRHGD